MHVLVVSNHQTDALLTQSVLQIEGFSVSVAPDVDDAVRQLSKYDVDVIVYDYRLSDAAPGSIRGRLRIGRNPPPVLAIVPSNMISTNDAQARLSLISQGIADAVLVRSSGENYEVSKENGRQFFAHLRRMALARARLKLPEETFGRFRINFTERRCFVEDGDWRELSLPHDGYDLLEYLVLYRNEFVEIEAILDRLNAYERTAPSGEASGSRQSDVIHDTGLAQLLRRLREQALTPVGLRWALENDPSAGVRFVTSHCEFDSRRDSAPPTWRRSA